MDQNLQRSEILDNPVSPGSAGPELDLTSTSSSPSLDPSLQSPAPEADAPSGIDRGRREKVGKATLAITFFSVLGRLLGYVEKSLVATFAGSAVSGAYFAASNVPWGIFSFIEQLLTHSFLPPFVEAREKRGDESAWNLASLVAITVFLLMALMTLVGVLGAGWYVPRFARGFSAADTLLTIRLTRIMLPAVVFMSVSSLTYVILNAYKQFALPAFADTALKIALVVTAIGLWHAFGIVAFALGLVFGAVTKFAVHLWGLRSKLPLVRLRPDFNDPAARALLALMAPLMLGNILSLVRPFLDVWFCGGSAEYAALKFAFTLTNLPFILIPYALGVALFPFLAEMAARGDTGEIRRSLISAFRMVVFLLLPITALYIALALPMVETVFMHGKFTAADSERVIAPLIWYSVGMIPIGMETVILQIFFSLSDTRTPTKIAYGTFCVYLIAGYLSTQTLHWGAAGVAMALTLSKIVKDLVLLKTLGRRIDGISTAGLGPFTGKLILATLALLFTVAGVSRVVYHVPTGATFQASSQTSSQASSRPVTLSRPASRVGMNRFRNGHPGSVGSGNTPSGQGHSRASHHGGKTRKMQAVKVFLVCSAPGILVFAALSWAFRIPELFILAGLVQRRLFPVAHRLAIGLTAPW